MKRLSTYGPALTRKCAGFLIAVVLLTVCDSVWGQEKKSPKKPQPVLSSMMIKPTMEQKTRPSGKKKDIEEQIAVEWVQHESIEELSKY